MANFVNYTQATTLMNAIAGKFAELGGAYVPKGSVAFAGLPATPTAAQVGYVYNITDDFTTDARFVEGAGKAYSAGTNVVIVVTGDVGSEEYKFDTLGNFIDISAIINKINAVAGMITGAFDATAAYTTGDLVTYEDALYKFTADKAAGAWDSTKVTATTIATLLTEVEPDSLTTEQLNALLAILA